MGQMRDIDLRTKTSEKRVSTAADIFEISTDRDRLDLDLIHAFLNQHSEWAAGIPRGVLERAVHNSLSFGAYASDGRQVGFARVVTDYATFAYLADIFVVEEMRGRGIAQQILGVLAAHPLLQGLKRWGLATSGGAGLYGRYGFAPLARAEALIEGLAAQVRAQPA